MILWEGSAVTFRWVLQRYHGGTTVPSSATAQCCCYNTSTIATSSHVRVWRVGSGRVVSFSHVCLCSCCCFAKLDTLAAGCTLLAAVFRGKQKESPTPRALYSYEGETSRISLQKKKKNRQITKKKNMFTYILVYKYSLSIYFSMYVHQFQSEKRKSDSDQTMHAWLGTVLKSNIKWTRNQRIVRTPHKTPYTLMYVCNIFVGPRIVFFFQLFLFHFRIWIVFLWCPFDSFVLKNEETWANSLLRNVRFQRVNRRFSSADHVENKRYSLSTRPR